MRDLKTKFIPYTILAAFLALRFAWTSGPFNALVERAIPVVPVPQETVKVEGAAIGLPNLGTGYLPAAKLDEINRLRISLSRYLRSEDETYYDLTQRSAFYYFLGKRVPAPYSADYLAANESIQKRIITRLEKENPPVVWIGGAMQFDEAPPSFRSYRIFRWLMENGYRYEAIDGNQFLVRPDRLLTPHTSEDLDALTPFFHRYKLYKQPQAWGRNLNRIGHRFELVQQLVAPGSLPQNHPGFIPEKNGWLEFRSGIPTFEFSLQALDQKKLPDFLSVSLSRRGPKNNRLSLQVSWAEQDESVSKMKTGYSMTLDPPQTLLIPLGSDPRWLKSKNLKSLTLQIIKESVGSKWRVEKAELLRLVK